MYKTYKYITYIPLDGHQKPYDHMDKSLKELQTNEDHCTVGILELRTYSKSPSYILKAL